MKIAIIGAGYGGLTVGYRLAKSGYDVTIFEYEKSPGGLAIGFKKDSWKWTIEKHYHHWFTNDDAALKLAKEISHKVIIKRPKTSTFIDGKIFQLDSPLSLLLFNKLSITDRFRTGAVLAYLKLTHNWKHLENKTSKDFLIKTMGSKSWEVLWEPLFEKKFADYAKDISASWFWARIKKRTPSLAYPQGGFLAFAEALNENYLKNGGKAYFGSEIREIESKTEKEIIIKTSRDILKFDKVVVTTPSPNFVKIVKNLPHSYVDQLLEVKGIAAVNLLISMNKRFLADKTYWLNINANHFPFLAVVEHTNFMNRKHYGKEHLVYVGNYLPQNHPYMNMESTDLFKEFYPYLKTINPRFSDTWVNGLYAFKAPFAQPVFPLNYSQKIPTFETPIKNLYLLNMSQVYPWDRGTNYAIENGNVLAEKIINEEI